MKRIVLVALGLIGCAHAEIVDDSPTVSVPAGAFTMGSDALDRGEATELSFRAGTFGRGTADSLAGELDAHRVELDAFAIMVTPVTQADYYTFVLDVGAPEPYVDPEQWAAARTGYSYEVVKAALWKRGAPDPERVDHPAVLVTHDEAVDYCEWWGRRNGGRGVLPTEAQWEKAARGPDGRRFPWGNTFRAGWLSSAETGAHATSPVDAHPRRRQPLRRTRDGWQRPGVDRDPVARPRGPVRREGRLLQRRRLRRPPRRTPPPPLRPTPPRPRLPLHPGTELRPTTPRTSALRGVCGRCAPGWRWADRVIRAAFTRWRRGGR